MLAIGVVSVAIKLAPTAPSASTVVSITPDFAVESAGPAVAAFDAVQSSITRFGALPSTKEYSATIHAGEQSAVVSCYKVTVSADNVPGLYLLQVTRSSLAIAVSVDVDGDWTSSGSGRATECEQLEPAP